MRLFSNILESADEFTITKEEFEQYLAAVSKNLPKEVNAVCHYLLKAQIFTKDEAEELINASTSKIKKMAKEKHVPENELLDCQKMMKKMKLEKQLLPMYQNEQTRMDFIAGTKDTDDVMLDLVSEKGRTAVVKQYTPLMNKIANDNIGKSSLGKPELLSAAMTGLVQAMNDYRKNEKELSAENDPDIEETKKAHRMTFAKYAAYRMQQQILKDINWYSRTVRIPTKTYQRHKDDEDFNYSSSSIDTLMGGNEDGESIADRMKELSVDPKDFELSTAKKNVDAAMKSIYKMIEDRFNMQKASIFYMTFGLNGYNIERATDIAKKFGLSPANISMSNKRIAKFLKETPAAQPLLKVLLHHVQESILIDNMNKSQQEIFEALINSDMYILLEDLTRWSEKAVFENTMHSVLSEYDNDSVEFLTACLNEGEEFLQDNYRENKKLIVHFLESINPTSTFSKKQDLYIIDEMLTIINAYKESGMVL